MIGLVEGAERQKTPNEIALNILLAGMTIIFVFAVASIPSFASYAGGEHLGPRPGGAVRDAHPDHHRRASCPPSASRAWTGSCASTCSPCRAAAVEAAGDVDTLLLDKTGTITLGNRQASEFLPLPGVSEKELADAAQLASLSDETPEGRSIVVLAKERYGIRGRDMAQLGAHLHPLHGADAHQRHRP